MVQIEVERRGPLTKAGYDTLHAALAKNGTFLKRDARLTLMYFRGPIPVHAEEIKDEKVDLRLRVTNKKPALVMKYGSWAGTDQRKEFSFSVTKDDFVQWIEFFACLDWKHCVLYATNTERYDYGGIEFALVEIVGYGYMYEAELLAEESTEKDVVITQLQQRIADACATFELREFHEGEFERQCDAVNNVRRLQRDFSKDDPALVLEEFKEFF